MKRYLNTVTLASDGLLVVQRDTPLSNTTDCIVVPRSVLHGLLMSLHIRLDHPSNQIKSNQITFIDTSPQHKCLGE